MKKITISLALIASLSVNIYATPAANLATGFSSEVTQLAQFAADGVAYGLDYAEQLAQYRNMVQRYQNQFTSYRMMLQNIGQLPQAQWNQFAQSVMGLKQALEFGDGLSYTMGNYDQQFNDLYKGYDSYLQTANGIDDPIVRQQGFATQYKKIMKSTRDTLNGSLKSLGLQDLDLMTDEATMRQLQTLSSSAGGQKAAIQAASEIALHQTHTLKKLQKTIMTQANVQSAFMLAQNEEKALKRAASSAYKSNRETINPNNDVPMP